jgi:hypothetical protein
MNRLDTFSFVFLVGNCWDQCDMIQLIFPDQMLQTRDVVTKTPQLP